MIQNRLLSLSGRSEKGGEEIHLKAGDVLTQRAIIQNGLDRGQEPCEMAFVLPGLERGQLPGW